MSEYVAFLRLLYDAVVADDGVLKPLEAVAFTDIAVEAGLIHLGLPTASLEDLDANAADSARAEVAATVAANRAAAKASAASIAEEPARKAMEAAHDTAEGAARKADEELEERRAWQEARWKARLQAYGDGAYGKDVFGRLYSALGLPADMCSQCGASHSKGMSKGPHVASTLTLHSMTGHTWLALLGAEMLLFRLPYLAFPPHPRQRPQLSLLGHTHDHLARAPPSCVRWKLGAITRELPEASVRTRRGKNRRGRCHLVLWQCR